MAEKFDENTVLYRPTHTWINAYLGTEDLFMGIGGGSGSPVTRCPLTRAHRPDGIDELSVEASVRVARCKSNAHTYPH
jgi:hypothetical protein